MERKRPLVGIFKGAFADKVLAASVIGTTACAVAALMFVMTLVHGETIAINGYLQQWDLDSVLVMGVSSGENPRRGSWTAQEIDDLRIFIAGRGEVAVYKYVDVHTLKSGGKTAGPRVVATDPAMLSIRKRRMSEGFAFQEKSGLRDDRTCLIGSAVKEQLFPNRTSIGQPIEIGTVPFTVLGAFEPRTQSGSPAEEDYETWIPLDTAKRYYSIPDSYRMILIRSLPSDSVHALANAVKTHLRELHALSPVDTDDFQLTFPDEIGAFYKQSTATVRLSAFLILAVCLVGGTLTAVGCSTLLVYKRQHELALKLAVGATRSDIKKELSGGALILSAIGAAAGMALGVVVLVLGPLFVTNVPLEIAPFQTLIPVVSVALLVTVVSALSIHLTMRRISPGATLAAQAKR